MAPSRQLHPNNRHLGKKGAAYDFEQLVKINPALKSWLQTSPRGNTTIDFANDVAVKELNKSLLMAFYNIQFWDLPPQFLCPPVPGRADYIHYLYDLLAATLPKLAEQKVRGLDIGTGANLIYPIIGSAEYKWQFVGTDIDKSSVKLAKQIIDFNPTLKNKVKVRQQTDANHIFQGILNANDRFTFSMCNPPFHESAAAANKGTIRKQKNLKQQNAKLNFGGRSNELWCQGGELQFINNMINESQHFGDQVLWFTSLVSKKENLRPLYQTLKQVKVDEIKTFDMAQGNKISRFIAWTFIPEQDRANWHS